MKSFRYIITAAISLMPMLGFAQSDYKTPSYFMDYVIAITAFVALVALFMIRPPKFKALPYIVLAVMTILICFMSDFLSDFDFKRGLIYDLVHNCGSLRYHYTSHDNNVRLLAAIPVVTLLVTMLWLHFNPKQKVILKNVLLHLAICLVISQFYTNLAWHQFQLNWTYRTYGSFLVEGLLFSIQFVALVELFYWGIRALDKRIKDCTWLVSIITLVLFVVLSVACIIDEWDTTYYLIAFVPFIALAALFFERPEKFKALPYIVLALMIVFMGMSSKWFYAFTNTETLIENIADELCKNIFTDNYYKIYATGVVIVTGIPTITLFVMMLVKRKKAKKAIETPVE